jgi:type IV pilus assembly protein PilO
MSKIALLKAVAEQSRGLLIFVCLLLLLSAGLYVYQVQVADPELKELKKRQVRLQERLTDREDNFAKSGVPISTVEQMNKDLTSFSELVPVKQNFADFVGDLFSWAEQAQLNIRQVSYQPKLDKTSRFLIYGLNFSVKGTYGQIKKFIHLLEKSERILVINKINMKGSITKSYSPVVNLQINLSTYFQEAAR